MIIQHNISAMNANRNLNKNAWALSKNLEKLSSGYRINRSADDAAGLSISEKMRAQIAGLDQAQNNVQDGISLIHTVEGALQEVHAMLDRIETLSTQSANGTLDDAQDRAALQKELDALKTEINRIGSDTKFNGINLFTGGGSPVTVAAYNVSVDLSTGSVTSRSIVINGENAGTIDEIPDGYKQLAEKIAHEYLPNAVNQILETFPSLKNAVNDLLAAHPGPNGETTIDMTLEIGNIDGAHGTLAYAQLGYSNTSLPAVLLIKVDTSDFSDDSIGTDVKLESTLAHELMHTVMQYTMMEEMVGLNGAEPFPTWFVEGTAQLSGGGFTTGWNNALIGMTDPNDIADYLNDYTATNRPYGHGYLAAAYLGYMANGGTGDVNAVNIAGGMEKIFEKVAQGSTLYGAINDLLGTSLTSMSALDNYVNGLFTNAASGDSVTTFVKNLVAATGSGAGSVVSSGGLSAGGYDVIGSQSGLNVPFNIKSFAGTGATGVPGSTGSIVLQIGETDTASSQLELQLFELTDQALGIGSLDISTQSNAQIMLGAVKNAVSIVSSIRAYYGANQNRLEHTLENLNVTEENVAASESRIRDVDVAEEFAKYTKNQILVQSAQSMLAQSNQVPQSVLTLMR